MYTIASELCRLLAKQHNGEGEFSLEIDTYCCAVRFGGWSAAKFGSLWQCGDGSRVETFKTAREAAQFIYRKTRQD